jgi:hypothetical protein
MAQIQNVASEQFVANGGDGGPVVVAGVPAPDVRYCVYPSLAG